VSFSLARLRALSPCELSVARWAADGRSNPAIASLRQTSIHTVARQMATVLGKLRVGARLDLATIPELGAWAPPRLAVPKPGSDPEGDDAWVSAEGLPIDRTQVGLFWREIAAGHWSPLASVDVGAVSYVAMVRTGRKTADWSTLRERERDVLGCVSRGLAQKVVAMKLGMAASTVSANLHSAQRRLGFASFARLVRAYCGARDLIEQADRSVSLFAP
jgi:DNA-binding CsgD family transcriptional regulator